MDDDWFEPLQVHNVYAHLGFKCQIETEFVYFLKHPINTQEIYVEKNQKVRTEFMEIQLKKIDLTFTLFNSLYHSLPIPNNAPECDKKI